MFSLLPWLVLASSAWAADPPDKPWEVNSVVSDGRMVSGVGLGEAQGGAWMNGKLYLYGDVSRAVPRVGRIREYDGNLVPTGRAIDLTQNGVPVITHPTGLTQDSQFGTLLGNTVNGVGHIYSLDWDRALADGNLDRAVKTVVQDDAAVNGTRPVFVEVNGKKLVATADYGDKTPRVRLYDPAKLLAAGKSSAPGVVVSTVEAGPFNQNLHWDSQTGTLVCVQNVVEGRGWRLDYLNLGRAMEAGRADDPGVRVGIRTFPPHDELEGYLKTPDGREIFITSSQADEVVVGRSEAIPGRVSQPGHRNVSFSEVPGRHTGCGPIYLQLRT